MATLRSRPPAQTSELTPQGRAFTSADGWSARLASHLLVTLGDDFGFRLTIRSPVIIHFVICVSG
jgi:hypothetical protein